MFNYPQTGSGNPYIHLTWAGYKRNIASRIDRSNLKNEIRRTYAQNRMEMTSRFENEINSDPALMDSLEVITQLHEKLLNADKHTFLDEQTLQKKFNEAHANIRKTGLHASLKSEKINDIMKDVDETIKLITDLNDILNEFEGLDKELISYCAKKNINTQQSEIGNLDSIQMFTERDEAMTSIKKLASQVQTLEAACEQATSDVSIDKSGLDNEDAISILTGISGRLSNISGMAFEEIIYRIYQGQFAKILEETLGTPGPGIKKVEILPTGKKFVQNNEDKKFRATSDIQIVIEPKVGKGEVILGLNLKAQRKNPSAKKTRTYFKSSMNWMEYFSKNGLLNTIYEYWLGNLILRKHFVNEKTNSYEKNFYELTLLKKLVAAKGAVNAVAGPGGDTRDTAFFLVYMDKIMTISDFFAPMAKDDRKGLNINTDNTGSVAIAPKTPDPLMRYVRSRSTLTSIRDVVKITMVK